VNRSYLGSLLRIFVLQLLNINFVWKVEKKTCCHEHVSNYQYVWMNNYWNIHVIQHDHLSWTVYATTVLQQICSQSSRESSKTVLWIFYYKYKVSQLPMSSTVCAAVPAHLQFIHLSWRNWNAMHIGVKSQPSL